MICDIFDWVLHQLNGNGGKRISCLDIKFYKIEFLFIYYYFHLIFFLFSRFFFGAVRVQLKLERKEEELPNNLDSAFKLCAWGFSFFIFFLWVGWGGVGWVEVVLMFFGFRWVSTERRAFPLAGNWIARAREITSFWNHGKQFPVHLAVSFFVTSILSVE